MALNPVAFFLRSVNFHRTILYNGFFVHEKHIEKSFSHREPLVGSRGSKVEDAI